MVRRNNGANLRDRLDGFTLIELLIVMVLLVLLAGVSLTVYGTSVQRGKEAALKEDLFQMRKAIDEYLRGQGQVPVRPAGAGDGEIPAEHRTRSVHGIGRDVADRAVGGRSIQSIGRAGHR